MLDKQLFRQAQIIFHSAGRQAKNDLVNHFFGKLPHQPLQHFRPCGVIAKKCYEFIRGLVHNHLQALFESAPFPYGRPGQGAGQQKIGDQFKFPQRKGDDALMCGRTFSQCLDFLFQCRIKPVLQTMRRFELKVAVDYFAQINLQPVNSNRMPGKRMFGQGCIDYRHQVLFNSGCHSGLLVQHRFL